MDSSQKQNNCNKLINNHKNIPYHMVQESIPFPGLSDLILQEFYYKLAKEEQSDRQEF